MNLDRNTDECKHKRHQKRPSSLGSASFTLNGGGKKKELIIVWDSGIKQKVLIKMFRPFQKKYPSCDTVPLKNRPFIIHLPERRRAEWQAPATWPARRWCRGWRRRGSPAPPPPRPSCPL
jgi:hypothetical protein